MAQYSYLRTFSTDELYLNEDETRIILKFFFPNDGAFIDGLVINDKVRAFAQGLLVEAIDATYTMGYLDILFRIVSNPAKGPVKIIRSFARKAAKYWFKNAKSCDLVNVKIYESVRRDISRSFRHKLQDIELAKNNVIDQLEFGAFLTYSRPSKMEKAWG